MFAEVVDYARDFADLGGLVSWLVGWLVVKEMGIWPDFGHLVVWKLFFLLIWGCVLVFDLMLLLLVDALC